MTEIEILFKRLSYDPQTGALHWVKNGKVAGGKNGAGYISIHVNGKHYLAHRIAWLLSFGDWPDHQVDHKDGNPLNNILENLRPATPKQNARNRKANGYYYSRRHKQFCASIWVDDKSKFLGLYRSEEGARSAYLVAAQEHFGTFARL